jgi:hypothetical protein
LPAGFTNTSSPIIVVVIRLGYDRMEAVLSSLDAKPFFLNSEAYGEILAYSDSAGTVSSPLFRLSSTLAVDKYNETDMLSKNCRSWNNKKDYINNGITSKSNKKIILHLVACECYSQGQWITRHGTWRDKQHKHIQTRTLLFQNVQFISTL